MILALLLLLGLCSLPNRQLRNSSAESWLAAMPFTAE